ncbi:MAG: HlyD family efflux transporter periplasmic adaptor subunit [Proteobacteria bacterium]|nr:HlyD family efflux transporter periplasmic adaptor subunit [Pseudomonadota bacterium]
MYETIDRPVPRPRGLTKKRALIGVFLLAAFIGSVIAYPSLRRFTQSERTVKLSRLRLSSVTRGELHREVSVEGRVVAAYHPTLYSSSLGIVTLKAKTGNPISKGDLLGTISSPKLENRLKQEQATLATLRSALGRQRIQLEQVTNRQRRDKSLLDLDLAAAKRARDRAEQSRALGILTEVEYEAAEDTVEQLSVKLIFARKNAKLLERSLKFEIKESKSALERQELIVEDLMRQVEALIIHSPVSGFVSRIHVEDRESVNVNAKLFTVVDLSTFEVEISVPENYADEIAPGTSAMMQIGNRKWSGKVKRISPEVTGLEVLGIVSFLGESPIGLKQNQRIMTRLIIESRPNVLKVRLGPFLQDGGGYEAYVIKEGMAVKRKIKVGARSVAEVEIVSGLHLGEQIVISETTSFKGANRVLLHQ